MPLIALIIVAMLQFWSVFWASANAHVRAREHVLHGDAYQRDSETHGRSVFDRGRHNYRRAEAGSEFHATSRDWTIPGASSSQEVDVDAWILTE